MGVGVEPKQIAHRRRLAFPDDETMPISHQAIYQSLSCKAAELCVVS